MQDANVSSWWNPAFSKRRTEKEKGIREEEKALHRKRLAAILRYIASMHHDVRSSGGYCHHRFVRPVDEDEKNEEDFFPK